MTQAIKFTIIIFMTNMLSTQAQALIPPKFKQAQPIWLFNLKSNYINKGSDDEFTEYNNIQPYNDEIEIRGDKCYFSSWITSENVATIGYSVCGIDIKKRALDFCYSTSYDSLSHEYYSMQQLTVQDSFIELYGKRGTNIQLLLDPFKHIFIRHHDIKTGAITMENTDKNNDKEDNAYGVAKYYKVKNNDKYVQVYANNLWFPTPKLDFQFVLFDTLMNQRTIKTIPHDPEQPIDAFSIQYAFSQRLNDSICVTFVKQRSTDFSKYPHRTWLYFFNVADTNNIRVVKKIDTKDRILYDESTDLSIRFTTKDKNVTFIDKWIDWDKKEVYDYLYRLDMDGNELQYVRTIKIKDHDHYYYWPVKLTDSTSYLLGVPSAYSNIPATADIVKINREGEGEYLASIFIDENVDDDGYFYIRQAALSQDNKTMIINGNYSVIPSSRKDLSAWSCGFLLDDLIKGSKTGTAEQIENSSTIKISPNPTSNIVKIETTEKIKNTYLMDEYGKVKTVKNIYEAKTIDLTNYPDGVYFLIISTESGRSYRSKIVKI